MAVLGFREILPRSYEHRIGGDPTASRVYVATVDEPTPTSVVLAAIGINHGDQHPDHTGLNCDGISAEETDRQHVTVTYSYTVTDVPEGGDPDQPPWLQPDVWTFGTSNASVACTEYYPDGFGNVAHPLTNTAGDTIFGVSRAESELKITITGSRLIFNLRDYKKYVNTINQSQWCGFPKHTVQIVGMSASPDQLTFEGQVLPFWRISFELVYRSSRHNIFLPNVGWFVKVDGKKLRAWAYIEVDGERQKVPTPHPVPLNMNGGFLCGPGQDGARDPNGVGDAGGNDGDDAVGYY